jgi:hypothetical protein
MIETPEEFAFIMDTLEVLIDDRISSRETRKAKARRITARDAAIRAECAERALVFYCQEVCFEDDEKQNSACRKRGGCKWANQLRAAIMGK